MKGGIYVHIPFCHSRCRYCSFYSNRMPGSIPWKQYARALIAQLESVQSIPTDFLVNSVYFGGGTPSVMPPQFFYEILDTFASRLHLSDEPEITMELNPEDGNTDYLRRIRASGINRLSIGLQSTDNKILQKLERRHSAETAFAVLNRATGIFANVSCDLIVGIQGESDDPQQLLAVPNLDQLQHVSVYMLDGEKNASLAADADDTADIYGSLISFLSEKNFEQYEISNFCKPNMASVHNLHYWTGDPYLGLGPSAHSFFPPKRFSQKGDLVAFLHGDFVETSTEYDFESLLSEMVMLSLRLTAGIDAESFRVRYGVDLIEKFGWLLERFPEHVIRTINGIALTSEGMLISNEIFQEIID